MLSLAERLRTELPGLSVSVALGGGSFKSQFKRADRSGARFAVVLGQQEVDQGVLQIKDLRASEPQQHSVEIERLGTWLKQQLTSRIAD